MKKSIVVILTIVAMVLTCNIASAAEVAIYTSFGSSAESILSVFRAAKSMGHNVYGIGYFDIKHGRLTTTNFDVLILPPAEVSTLPAGYPAANYYRNLGCLDYPTCTPGLVVNDEIRTFVDNGGGFVGIQLGAYYACANWGDDYLNLYPGDYVDYTTSGKEPIDIVDTGFGSGSQDVYFSAGSGKFTGGGTVVARDADGDAVIVRYISGSKRVILSAAELSLRGDSFDDWTIWDNYEMGSHTNSEGAWKLLGRMIDWADGDDTPEEPTIAPPSPTAANVAVISTHLSDGGAWPGLIPAVGRSIANAGHTPLAIRFDDVNNDKLKTEDFDVVVFPGGDATGYKNGLDEQKIRDFVADGNGFFGICAGAYYAASIINWEGGTYETDNLELYSGEDTGAIDEIAPWPEYTVTKTNINDTIIGNLGDRFHLYYGGGYKTTSEGEITVATYEHTGGTYTGYPNAIRFTYGAGDGRVLLVGTHPESRDDDEDWLRWNNYEYGTDISADSHNGWPFVEAVFNNWLLEPNDHDDGNGDGSGGGGCFISTPPLGT